MLFGMTTECFCENTVVQIFFEKQLPELIEALNRIADKRTGIGAEGGALEADEKIHRVKTIYLCLEENSPALYPEVENISHMFFTCDREQMKKWLNLSLTQAEKGQYKPLFEEDIKDFETDLETQKSAKLWMYKNGKENSTYFYGICVYVFDPCQPQEAGAVFEGGRTA